jgi:membrane protein
MYVIRRVLRAAVDGWFDDKIPQLGAALAYYTLFSLAPLLIIAIGIAGLIFGEKAARGEVVTQVESAIGQPAASAVQDLLISTGSGGGSILATIGGIGLLLFGASGAFVQLQDSLNWIWKVQPKPGRGIRGVIRDRLLSFLVVLSTGLLLFASLLLNAALAVLERFLASDALPGGTHLWQALSSAVSLLIVMLLFALIYRVLPDVQISWRHVWLGAILTALLFTAGKYVIGLYLGWTATASVFGAAASLVVILIWLYYSAQILLFGAELTHAFAQHCGVATVPKHNAKPIPCDNQVGTAA